MQAPRTLRRGGFCCSRASHLSDDSQTALRPAQASGISCSGHFRRESPRHLKVNTPSTAPSPLSVTRLNRGPQSHPSARDLGLRNLRGQTHLAGMTGSRIFETDYPGNNPKKAGRGLRRTRGEDTGWRGGSAGFRVGGQLRGEVKDRGAPLGLCSRVSILPGAPLKSDSRLWTSQL